MSLTEVQLNENKNRYLALIKSISSDKGDIDRFIKWITERSDFFEAPASTKYHGSFVGGLCLHSLNVYDNLVKLVESQNLSYSSDTLKIVALLHDLSKANLYERYIKNVKNDVTGEWEKVPEYKVRDSENRFIYGNHEQNSEYMARSFFDLTLEESTAILHHHAGKSWDSAQDDIGTLYNKYTLALLLHLADMLATFYTENIHVN